MPFCDDSVSRLSWELVKSRVPEKYYNIFELELKFLRTFLKYTSIQRFENHNLEIFLMRAEDVDQRSRRDLKSLLFLSLKEIETTFSNMVTYVVDEVRLMRSEIIDFYWMVSKASRSYNSMSNELVIEFIDSLLENLKDLLSFKVDLVGPLKSKLEALERKLRFLNIFLLFTRETCAEHEKLNDLFTHAIVSADNAAYLSYSFLVDGMDEDMVENLVFDLSDLSQKIGPMTPKIRQIYIGVLKASSESLGHTSSKSSGQDLSNFQRDKVSAEFVESLQENVIGLLSAGFTVPMGVQIDLLQEGLAFLGGFLMDPPFLYAETQILSDLLKQSKAMSVKAGLVVYSLCDNKMNEETTEKVYSSLVDFLEEIKLFKAELYLKSSFPRFPSTDELGFLDCFFGNLTELLNNRTESVASLNLPVEAAEDLQLLVPLFSRIAKQHEEEKLELLRTQVMNVAYKAEYIIDSLLTGNGPMWHHKLWLTQMRDEIKILKAEVNKIGENKMHDSEVSSGDKFSCQVLSKVTSPEMDEVIVGFNDEEKILVEDLVRGSTKLKIVLIVGMPGLGKTHLGKRIYNNPIVNDYFDVHTWSHVSQTYNRRHLLTHILSQVVEPVETMSRMNDEELAEALYKGLKGKRYLILLDDLWDVGAWDAFKRSIPDDNNGSRLMITSRIHNLDLEASRLKIHPLRSFSDDESWQLLQKKLFQNERSPSCLLEVGKQIAKNCNGLPLAVVVVAGILARIDKKLPKWKEVANSLNSLIIGDPEKQCTKIMELSYYHLPDYLKPCFLYTGVFLKNKCISVQKLIRLWIAEGFVHEVERNSLENVAENYLMDLTGRSLIIITKRRSNGGIKECIIHDLVRDFCIEKFEKCNFLQHLERPHAFDPSSYIVYEQRRICCYKPELFLQSNAYGPQVRTLMFSSRDISSRYLDISFICYRVYSLFGILSMTSV